MFTSDLRRAVETAEIAFYRDCVERMRSFLADVAHEFDGRRVLVIAHAAQRWALRNLLEGVPLEELVDAPFDWQEGWEYRVSAAELR